MKVKMCKKVLVPALAAMVLSVPVAADDVIDTINDALSAYKSGEYKTAAEDLGYAQSLVKQKRGESLKQYLPEAIEGWTVEQMKVQTAGAAMFGGGTMVKAVYKQGRSKVTIELVTDSPMLQSIAMMISNPMFATSDGGKLVRINRQKAIVKYKEKNRSGEVKMVAKNVYLITVNGTQVSEEVLMKYTKGVKTRKLP